MSEHVPAQLEQKSIDEYVILRNLSTSVLRNKQNTVFSDRDSRYELDLGINKKVGLTIDYLKGKELNPQEAGELYANIYGTAVGALTLVDAGSDVFGQFMNLQITNDEENAFLKKVCEDIQGIQNDNFTDLYNPKTYSAQLEAFTEDVFKEISSKTVLNFGGPAFEFCMGVVQGAANDARSLQRVKEASGVFAE